MTHNDWLAARFEENRRHLRRIAYRMLGSTDEAEDALHEAWMRASRAGRSTVDNLGGWLTTTVARICLDMLRARRAHSPSQPEAAPDAIARIPSPASDPETELLFADSVGPALLIILDTLGPTERVAFVLHDMFDLSFDEIASIIGRSSAAARQLASRARRRLQGKQTVPDSDLARHRELVDAFLAASREGNFERLMGLLDPAVVLRADDLAVQTAAENQTQARGAPLLAKEIRGPRAVAESLRGRARGAQPALIDGFAGAIWAQGGQTRAVFAFVVESEKIVDIELVMDPKRLTQIDVEATLRS